MIFTLQFDIEDVLNFVAPYGILTNTSVANFKNALSGTAILETSSRGAILCTTILCVSNKSVKFGNSVAFQHVTMNLETMISNFM